MNHRPFGPTGRDVSEIGLGCWQIGGSWGEVSEETALALLSAAHEGGIDFFDTADVYGGGRSERLIGRFLAERSLRGEVFVATKLGRRGDPGGAANLTPEVMRRHTDDSLKNLGVEALDLTQLHCVSADALRDGAVFDALRDLRSAGKIRAFGASVESMDEAMTCLQQPGLASLQIIFNALRQKPITTLFDEAKAKRVALIVRLPLASGLLAGKFDRSTTFAKDDHRNFNRDGNAFNVGETFSGLPFGIGVDLAEKARPMLTDPMPDGTTMAQAALRWILDHDAVTTVIAGASRPQQAADNAAASGLPRLPAESHRRLSEFYHAEVAGHIRGPY